MKGLHVKDVIVLAATAAFFLPTAAAATLTQVPDGEIVVTGETRKQAERQAQAYIRQLGVANGHTQAARWIGGVCPHVIGIRPEHAKLVERRIRDIATGASVPLAREGCRGNLIIAFTDDGKAVARKISKMDLSPVARVSASEADRIKNGDQPVRWWYNISTQSSDGAGSVPLSPPGAAFADASGNRADPPINDRTSVIAQYNSSLVSTLTVRGITSATVVVDVERASGASLASIIDYAALVGLAEVRNGAAPDGSILSLFKPAAAPKALTDRDEAFLKGLYKITLDRKADQQQRTLVGQMVKETAAN